MIDRYLHPSTVQIQPIDTPIKPSFIAQAKWQENPDAQSCTIVKTPDHLKSLEGKQALVFRMYQTVCEDGTAIVDERNIICVE